MYDNPPIAAPSAWGTAGNADGNAAGAAPTVPGNAVIAAAAPAAAPSPSRTLLRETPSRSAPCSLMVVHLPKPVERKQTLPRSEGPNGHAACGPDLPATFPRPFSRNFLDLSHPLAPVRGEGKRQHRV